MSDVSGSARLRFANVHKAFDGTVALSGVSFVVGSGEIHALLGANGAGKSTLIKLLAGIHSLDSGQILLDDSDQITDVSFIHQDLGLVETLSVAECIAQFEGYPRRAGLINWKAVEHQAQEALDVLGATIDVRSPVGELSRADRSIVAIARALRTECRVLVLDEPTASLPQADVARLFAVLRMLRARGVSVIYVTHRLDEVFDIADRFTLLRDGRVVAGGDIADLTHTRLVQLITNAPVSRPDLATTRPAGAHSGVEDGPSPRLPPRSDADGYLRLSGIQMGLNDGPRSQLTLRRGEILGLVGLRGSGQEALGRGIAGVEALEWTSITLDGRTYTRPKAARRALRGVVGFASSRREAEGLAMTMTVRENLFLNPGSAGRRTLSWTARGNERRRALAVGSEIHLHPNRSETVVGTLSGGNQQKVVLGRWLNTNVHVLVLEEPTMGIDVGARAEIYDLIRRTAAHGRSVIVVSSDFDELVRLCARVVVIDRGTVSAELVGADVNVENMTKFSTGATQEPEGHHAA